jgi:hypothetical protein
MVDFFVNGKRYQLSRQQVEAAVRDLEPDYIQSLAVFVNGEWWPAKQPFVTAIGLRNVNVNSRTALRHLERLGFRIHDKATQGPLPSTEAEPEALDDSELREVALSLAVELVKGQSQQASDALGVAQEFLTWLGGAERR